VELDDVIDQVIAERVIARHRGKWIAAFVLLLVLAVVILVLGGWKKPEGRQVPTYDAPKTVDAGKWRFEFVSAKLIHEPGGTYSSASSRVEVKAFVTNIDDETRTSDSVYGRLLRLVPAKGDLIESNGAKCDGELNYKIVYGLKAKACVFTFDVDPRYEDTAVEIGVLGESYESDEGFAVSDRPYWHNEAAVAVVDFKAEEVTEKK
jgi:hypothetical protein